MKKQIFLILVLLTCFCPLSYGQVSVSIGVSVPPPIAFTAPPQLIVLPDTDDVYVCPYLDFDLFFWNGWWWRYWRDRWYYSRYYNDDWLYYDGTPSFYFDVDPDWRVYYLDRDWDGYPWDYEFIPAYQVQVNWGRWRRDRYWERDRHYDVQGDYRPRDQAQRESLRAERQQQYQRAPEARPNQPLRQQLQRVPQRSSVTRPQGGETRIQRSSPEPLTPPSRSETSGTQQRAVEPARPQPAEQPRIQERALEARPSAPEPRIQERAPEPRSPAPEPRIQERAPEPARVAPEAARPQQVEPRQPERPERRR